MCAINVGCKFSDPITIHIVFEFFYFISLLLLFNLHSPITVLDCMLVQKSVCPAFIGNKEVKDA